MNKRWTGATAYAIALMLAGTHATAAARAPLPVADAIYFGGVILTMEDHLPTAEALAVKDGRILAVGALPAVQAHQGPGTREQDLHGAALLPGFVDAHSHVSLVGFQAASANLLPAPDGQGETVADLQRLMSAYLASSQLPQELGVGVGFGYDDARLAEGRHPTRADLDTVAAHMPLLAIHQSFHLGVLNSQALEAVGYTATTPDPPGGKIWRDPRTNQPTGLVEEAAFFNALNILLANVSPQSALRMLEAGQQLYLKHGYTTLQDGRASALQVEVAKGAAQLGLLKADVVAYPDALDANTEAMMVAPWFHDVSVAPTYHKGFRIGGVKLGLDGSPQGKTAWLSQPYFKPPPGEGPEYAGHGSVSDAQVLHTLQTAFARGWQVLAHANGDRAIDQLLDGVELANQLAPGQRTRPVLIHGQTLREDQVGRLQSLQVFPSLFPMHTFYWGDWHRTSVLGPERAENISPTGWLMERGMRFSTHHDAPVVSPNAMRVLASTVRRVTRSGHVLGQQHRVPVSSALKAMTLWPAYQHFEEGSKGSLAPGKLADLVILADNPLQVPRAQLETIEVLETIKAGQTVYRKP